MFNFSQQGRDNDHDDPDCGNGDDDCLLSTPCQADITLATGFSRDNPAAVPGLIPYVRLEVLVDLVRWHRSAMRVKAAKEALECPDIPPEKTPSRAAVNYFYLTWPLPCRENRSLELEEALCEEYAAWRKLDRQHLHQARSRAFHSGIDPVSDSDYDRRGDSGASRVLLAIAMGLLASSSLIGGVMTFFEFAS